MPEYRRANVPGGTYFFIVNTFRRGKFLTHEPFRNALHHGIEMARADLPFEIVAWVLLPEHLHCIWRLPEGGADFSKRWAIIKRAVSKQCGHLVALDGALSASKIARKESAVWQRRFWEHQIRDDVDLQRHVDYIHFNPVKHGHVARVADWPYSSFHRYVRAGQTICRMRVNIHRVHFMHHVVLPGIWCMKCTTERNDKQGVAMKIKHSARLALLAVCWHCHPWRGAKIDAWR